MNMGKIGNKYVEKLLLSLDSLT